MQVRISRRSVLGGLFGGAAGLVLPPAAIAQLVGPAHGIIRLTSNENPYGPSPAALKVAEEASASGAFYPGRISGDLIRVIAEREGIGADGVALSSGSNEALCAAAMAWGRHGRVLAPALTYDLHLGYAEQNGVEVATVPLDPDMGINLGRLAAAVDDRTSLVYVCNPNNPTGMLLDGDDLRAFCREVGKRATIVVDEAYNELTGDPAYSSMMNLVRAGENVIVMRTFSKIFGMAGMRIGYAMGRPDLIGRVRDSVMSWPNIVGLAMAYVSYTDDEFIAFSRDRILEGRKIVSEAFRRNGVEPLPSETNFVFADIGVDVNELAARMRDRNIEIRRSYPPYDTWMRVSMGKLDELEIFADVFDELYPQAKG
ncbi:MAG: histidinol-phosphate aminotransferase family protein [Gammaproteobacteria bacterium]|nr:histidinol-phosphate aminotransferase family protein [Gammaproteobacteria bacterium]MDH4254333.1 histidinol-phosphate aminotransferase family protein [Gammaproteobacteria bacterium]MDH5309615.1 histidinol-phosphate aminotransferase family protein [Gammaproteobacteria bacterium]